MQFEGINPPLKIIKTFAGQTLFGGGFFIISNISCFPRHVYLGGSMSQGIKAWPVDDRPREKLWKYGEDQLSNSELLAILLRTGSRGVSAVDLSRKILEKFGTFRNMSHTDIRDWKELKGLGTAKIASNSICNVYAASPAQDHFFDHLRRVLQGRRLLERQHRRWHARDQQ